MSEVQSLLVVDVDSVETARGWSWGWGLLKGAAGAVSSALDSLRSDTPCVAQQWVAQKVNAVPAEVYMSRQIAISSLSHRSATL